MSRLIVILAVIIAGLIPAYGQQDELNKLADLVMGLRTGGSKAYENAIAVLAKDNLWTPMDEVGIDAASECRASERVPGFRLNSILTNAENSNRYQTSTANHLNGADLRYNYSLYEKTLKSGKSRTISLRERWGDQVILIIPYNADSKISAKAQGAAPFKVSSLGNGVLKLTGRCDRNTGLKLEIKNDGAESLSYVIINYNSRQ